MRKRKRPDVHPERVGKDRWRFVSCGPECVPPARCHARCLDGRWVTYVTRRPGRRSWLRDRGYGRGILYGLDGRLGRVRSVHSCEKACSLNVHTHTLGDYTAVHSYSYSYSPMFTGSHPVCVRASLTDT